MMKQFLLIIKPMTDVSGIELEEKTCACGCRQKFRVSNGSKQKYRSEDCKKFLGHTKEAANAIWRRQMQFMVQG